jgi:hypothetical protein
MGTRVEYLRFARECVQMAGTTQDEKTRAILMQMAQVWFRLAESKTDDETR